MTGLPVLSGPTMRLQYVSPLVPGQLDLGLRLLSSVLPVPFSSMLLAFPSPLPRFRKLLLSFLRTVYLLCFHDSIHSQNRASIFTLTSDLSSGMIMIPCILINAVDRLVN